MERAIFKYKKRNLRFIIKLNLRNMLNGGHDRLANATSANQFSV